MPCFDDKREELERVRKPTTIEILNSDEYQRIHERLAQSRVEWTTVRRQLIAALSYIHHFNLADDFFSRTDIAEVVGEANFDEMHAMLFNEVALFREEVSNVNRRRAILNKLTPEERELLGV